MALAVEADHDFGGGTGVAFLVLHRFVHTPTSVVPRPRVAVVRIVPVELAECPPNIGAVIQAELSSGRKWRVLPRYRTARPGAPIRDDYAS